MLGLPSILPWLPALAQTAETATSELPDSVNFAFGVVVAGIVQIALAVIKGRGGGGNGQCRADQLAPVIQDLRNTIRDSFGSLSEAVTQLRIANGHSGATLDAKLDQVAARMADHDGSLKQLLLQTDRREARSGDAPSPVGVERRRRK